VNFLDSLEFLSLFPIQCCAKKRWEPNKPIMYIAFIHVCILVNKERTIVMGPNTQGFYQMPISWIPWNFSLFPISMSWRNMGNQQTHHLYRLHSCMYPCKGREDHCHGFKHLRLLLLNANILDSLKYFIVFNFNVVEKDGTLINSSLVNKGRTIVMGRNTLCVYQMPISWIPWNFSLFSISMLWRKMEPSSIQVL